MFIDTIPMCFLFQLRRRQSMLSTSPQPAPQKQPSPGKKLSHSMQTAEEHSVFFFLSLHSTYKQVLVHGAETWRTRRDDAGSPPTSPHVFRRQTTTSSTTSITADCSSYPASWEGSRPDIPFFLLFYFLFSLLRGILWSLNWYRLGERGTAVLQNFRSIYSFQSDSCNSPNQTSTLPHLS